MAGRAKFAGNRYGASQNHHETVAGLGLPRKLRFGVFETRLYA